MANSGTEYLRKINAPQFFDDLLRELVQAQPDDHVLFIKQYLENQKTSTHGAVEKKGGIPLGKLPSSSLFDIEAVVKAINVITAPKTTTNELWIRTWDRSLQRERMHQFVLFMKPEAIDYQNGVDTASILGLIAQSLQQHNIQVGAVRVLGGPYLEKTGMISEHYGVISKISRNGESAISDEAKAKLNGEFRDEFGIGQGAEVLGGHQFLQKFPDFSALALTTMNENVGNKKLAGGTYATKIKVQGKTHAVLNAFHPYQLVPFTSPGRGIVVFECLSTNSWDSLRGRLCGATNPAVAQDGSIRNQLLARQKELGLPNVNTSANGIHLSAGPVEGMAEVKRFFLKDQPDFSGLAFADMLKKSGLTEADVVALSNNQILQVDGKAVSVFDLTEEIDAAKAVDLIASALKRR